MNKAFSDGNILTPPSFSEGLGAWFCGEGRPMSDEIPGCRLVTGDTQFGTCLEIERSGAVQRLRHLGETPVLPGRYLRISARLRAVGGPVPSVRIAAWPGDASSGHVPGLSEAGVAATVPEDGETVEVSAILGTGARIGVDMAWGLSAAYAHIGLDLTGPVGGAVRIAAISVEDVTHLFLRPALGWVDVRDFGAAGDGEADDQPAFLAADRAARGRGVLVPEGLYRLGSDVRMRASVRFEGQVAMADDHLLFLGPVLKLEDYAAAFGGPLPGFRRAFRALMTAGGARELDLCGMQIPLAAPIDMEKIAGGAVPGAARTIRDGGFICAPGTRGYAIDFSTYSMLSDVTLRDVCIDGGDVASGLRLGAGASGWTLQNCSFRDLALGAELSGTGHRVIGCHWNAARWATGLRIRGQGATMLVSGNHFERSLIEWVGSADDADAPGGIAVTGNVFSGDGASDGRWIILHADTLPEGLVLTGNSFPAAPNGAGPIAIVSPGSAR